jgi:hypothetical protein
MIIDCPDPPEGRNRAVWSQLLWELNQPDEHGKQRYAIILNRMDDIKRLRRALVLKRTVELNASRHKLTLQNFSLGRLLLMPEIKPEQVFLIDEQVAKYFFFTEQYYPAVKRELTRDLAAMQTMFEDPRILRYLDDPDQALAPLQWQP